MSALLWTLLALGIFEAGGAVAFLFVGKWPQRTKGSLVFHVLVWTVFAIWAGRLLSTGVY